MDTLAPGYVRLPDGDVVHLSTNEEAWWTKSNGSGHVNPALLAPDPEQPRKDMDPVEQAELQKSVESKGVRQIIIVTPRHLVPWARVLPEDEGKFFLIVAGHRRTKAALMGGVAAVPIVVRVYASEKDHLLDVSLLNYQHADLTDLEKGQEMVKLRNVGWTTDELSGHFGMAVPQIYSRMNLLKLAPELKALLGKKVTGKRLGLTIGGQLGALKVPELEELEEIAARVGNVKPSITVSLGYPDRKKYDALDDDGRRFALQKLLYGAILHRGISSDRAQGFIREHGLILKAAVHAGGGGAPPVRFQPAKRQEVIKAAIRGITGSLAVDWPPQELLRIFELSSREDIEATRKSLKTAADFLKRLDEALAKLQAGKKPTRPEVLAILDDLHPRKTG